MKGEKQRRSEREGESKSYNMSSDEEIVYFSASEASDGSASDIEGEDEANEDEDNESDDDYERELEEKLNDMRTKWDKKKPRTKKQNKDLVNPKKVLFSPKTVMDRFNQFMTKELKEHILKYTNMKGNNLLILMNVFINIYFRKEG